ncbi:hypothetical protein QYF36_003284 [Acer negundo]|nr:hypothetical protein QYF36_003284 [Acer negundo]
MNISSGSMLPGKEGFLPSHDMSFGGFFVPESEPQSKEEIDRVCDTVFERFDQNQNGNIDRDSEEHETHDKLLAWDYEEMKASNLFWPCGKTEVLSGMLGAVLDISKASGRISALSEDGDAPPFQLSDDLYD